MTSLHDPTFHSAGAKLVVRHIFAINFSLQNIYYRNLLDLYYDFAILRHITLFLLFHFSFRTLLYYSQTFRTKSCKDYKLYTSMNLHYSQTMSKVVAVINIALYLYEFTLLSNYIPSIHTQIHALYLYEFTLLSNNS